MPDAGRDAGLAFDPPPVRYPVSVERLSRDAGANGPTGANGSHGEAILARRRKSLPVRKGSARKNAPKLGDLERVLENAADYAEWRGAAEAHDELSGAREWREEA